MQNPTRSFKTVYLKDDTATAALFLPPESFATYEKELEVGCRYDITFNSVRIRTPKNVKTNRKQYPTISPLKSVTIVKLADDGKNEKLIATKLLKQNRRL